MAQPLKARLTTKNIKSNINKKGFLRF
ncbi:rCG29042 [Rattus norvegicus]|uniref:RCG29042 n=1 Tax=Rattus norvegicus TaxID=10116 RepID=A6HWA0_RAT|nr:rCG29042 [Rattus norvegicus]